MTKREKVRVGVVAYGGRESAMIDAFARSRKYDVELIVADKQKNPFNLKRAKKHKVIDLSDVKSQAEFFREHHVEFVIPGSETPIIAGLADELSRFDIPAICPTKEYALEASKVQQRLLTQEIAPEVSPRFRVWYPDNSKSMHRVKDEFYKWLDELECQVAVKPDKPGFGKGVGVWGDHFNSPEEAWKHFRNLYEGGPVIVEEKIEGEEFSFQCLSDGARLVPLPAVRDYKRRFEGDKGPNTGSMGDYKDTGYLLPFMTEDDYNKAFDVTYRKFLRLRGNKTNPGLRGVPFYVAFTCTKDGIKHFEDNSRFGDPEGIGLLATMEDDLVDVCFDIINGNLSSVRFKPLATVGTYLVPRCYPDKDKKERKIDLSEAYELMKFYGDEKIRIYPASMEKRDGQTYSGTSRTVYVLGIGNSIPEAREICSAGVNAIANSNKGSDLDYRPDIGSQEHIERSIRHMRELRGKLRNL